MDRIEIRTNEVIAEAIGKLIEKYQKKAEKEKEKAKQAYVTYKGEKYYTEADLMDAYAFEGFTEKTYDRLLDKLNAARGGVDRNQMTESEMMVLQLQKHRNNLLHEVAFDRKLKERQTQTDKRMRELVEEGYSIREAETIIGNEELMRYE